MSILTVQAPGKLNLSLDILGRRPDGYHDLRMVMISVSLADAITLKTGTGKPLSVRTNLSFLPNDRRNLAAIAATRFQEETGKDAGGIAIDIQKRIPVCAGMGGGSSDAAAVLRALNDALSGGYSTLELAGLGASVGSDVPYCVLGGTALAEGRGELLTPLPSLPRCAAVVCKPPFSVSTPELFARADGVRLRHHPDTQGMEAALRAGDLGGTARRLYNVFEDVLPRRQAAQVHRIKDTLIQQGALGACMSGSGPTVFGLFEDKNKARSAWEELRRSFRDTFLTETI